MNLVVAGRHVDVTEAMKNYARQKVEKLSKYFNRLSSVKVTMDIEAGKHSVEIVATAVKGATLVAHHKDDDMYAAIDLATAKLERQLKRLKEKLQKHHG